MTIELIKEKITPIAMQYGISKLAQFGSVASGESNQNSDIDILIEKGELTNPLLFCEFCDVLEDTLGKSVDVVIYTDLQDSYFRTSILSKEIVIYERE